ncbi:MAG: hypothetical protein HKM28_06600 [Flavobacteriaceae bacterium]|nr:hypothetical protein [Flavobacteriaceae bacterium]
MIRAILSLCLLLFIVSCQSKTDQPSEDTNDSSNTDELSVAETIAYKNGLENWDEVTEIDFTFNVDRGGNHFERSWKWNPTTHDVTLMTSSDTIRYNRKQVDSLTLQADSGFINDSYWLLAPFKLVWDEGTSFSEVTKELAPISQDTLNKITLTYGDEGGYTPGDAYDLFYDSKFILREWIFRKGNAPSPSMITTFEDYEKYEGLNIAKMHKDSTGTFQLYFTNISVR